MIQYIDHYAKKGDELMGMQEFSQVLKKEREARHLSQTQLSECMSVTPQAVSKWERARGCPDMDMLCKLAYD